MLGMKAAAVIGGISLIIIMMLGASIYFLNGRLEVANKEIGNLSGQVIGLQGEIKTTDALAVNNKLHNSKYNTLQNSTDERIQGLRNDFTNKITTGFTASQNSPETFADSVDVDFYRLMCRIQGRTDLDAIQTCSNITADTLENSKPFTITITQENAETYRLVCENYKYWIVEATDEQREAKGEEYITAVAKTYDFCRWSVTGFTVETFYGMFMPYLTLLEKKLFDQAAWIETVSKQVEDREEIVSAVGAAPQQ